MTVLKHQCHSGVTGNRIIWQCLACASDGKPSDISRRAFQFILLWVANCDQGAALPPSMKSCQGNWTASKLCVFFLVYQICTQIHGQAGEHETDRSNAFWWSSPTECLWNIHTIALFNLLHCWMGRNIGAFNSIHQQGTPTTESASRCNNHVAKARGLTWSPVILQDCFLQDAIKTQLLGFTLQC